VDKATGQRRKRRRSRSRRGEGGMLRGGGFKAKAVNQVDAAPLYRKHILSCTQEKETTKLGLSYGVVSDKKEPKKQN
jgi:hypothetical protein